jgi:hypothetical protein
VIRSEEEDFGDPARPELKNLKMNTIQMINCGFREEK